MAVDASPLPPAVGTRRRKLDAEGIVTGTTRYVDDLRLPGMLFTRVRMASVPSGRITRLDTTRARALPGVRAVVTAADIPHNAFGLGHEEQRVMCDGEVRFRGQLVAAVAADTEDIAQRAVDLIEVEYEVGAGPMLDPHAAMAPGARAIREGGNVVRYGERDHREIRLGDADGAMAGAAHQVAGTFRTQMREHASMEPHCSVAEVDEEGRLTIHSCNQIPHITRAQIASVLGRPVSSVRLVVGHIGGGFGAKIDMLEDAVTGLLALQARRPVKWRWTREQEFVLSSIDHAYAGIEMETGLTEDGRMLARRTRAVCDIGRERIFGDMGVDKFGVYARGPYRIDDYAYDGHAVFTNRNGAGAVRGFHVIDATWAFECHMDDCAAALGADPLTFRLRNLLRDGDLSVTGSRMYDVTARECALAAAAAVGWHPNEADLRDDRRPARAASAPSRRYGVGISVGISGTGVLGGGDPASAEVSIEVDGTVVVRFGSPEDGAGEKTTMALIAAEALAVDPDHVAVVATDTDATPWTAGTFGNRVTFIDGNAVMRAAQDARRQALAVAGRQLGLAPEELSWLPHGNVSAPDGRAMTLAEIGATAVFVQAAPITGRGTFETGAAPMEPDRGQGHATGAYLFAASAVELEVDVETGELDLLNVVLCHDVGRAVNPLFVEGQFDGGISWSIGAAMLEDLMPRYPALDFQPRNFDTYKLPTVLDMPPRENIVLEIPSSDGPFGAKALGEYTANLSHAAIGNALRHATGVRVGRLPLTPERVLRALDEAGPVRRGA